MFLIKIRMKKNRKIFFIILLIVLVVIFFGTVFAEAVFFVPASEITSPYAVTVAPVIAQKTLASQDLINKSTPIQTYPASYPKQLRIPSIEVNAKIQYVGITKNGNMATPNNFTDVGWFQNGIVPGNQGSAVIDGHVDNGLAWPAVFANLGNLNIGDDIYIDTIGGTTIDFKVIGIKNYDPNADTEEIFNQNDGNYLKLITCAGTWSILHKTHDQRLVVTAEQL
jgi:LPXTG-site transpeptidase (sortase) family protein